MFRPIEGEEWIEEFRESDFWIRTKQDHPENLYARLCKSYLGWWLYFRVHSLWPKAALLIDPLSCGGMWSHINSFLYNFLVVGVWWRVKHEVWKRFHRKEWERQVAFMRAASQAMEEGCSDPMPAPPGFEGMNFIGWILGARYFRRVAEIMQEKDASSGAEKGGRNENLT